MTGKILVVWILNVNVKKVIIMMMENVFLANLSMILTVILVIWKILVSLYVMDVSVDMI